MGDGGVNRGINPMRGSFYDNNDVFNLTRLLLSPAGYDDFDSENVAAGKRYTNVSGLTINFNKTLRNFDEMYEESLESVNNDQVFTTAAEVATAAAAAAAVAGRQGGGSSRGSLNDLYERFERNPKFKNKFLKTVSDHYKYKQGILIPVESLKMTVANKNIFSALAAMTGINDKSETKKRLPRFYDEYSRKKFIRDSDAIEEQIKLNSTLFR